MSGAAVRRALLAACACALAAACAHGGAGEPGASRTAEEERNLALVLEMYQNVLIEMNPDAVDTYIAEDYIQHSQYAAPGRQGLKDFLAMVRVESPDAEQEIKRAVVDGNMVAVNVHVRRFEDDPGLAVADFFRVENGKIAEHWDIIQDVPVDAPNPLSMLGDGR